MKASTKQWLDLAKADLINCERIIDDDFLTTIVAFHSQQAVEKTFKALIEEKNINVPRIHSLIRLYDIIEKFLKQPFETRELLALDNVYTSSRHPSDIGMIVTGKPTIEDAEEFYQIAKKIYDTITEIID